MSKVLYFDCFSGASGDMILGALIDAGLPLEELREALGSLAIGDVRLRTERVERSGIGATSFTVEGGSGHTHDGHDHDAHDHHHHHHHHRGLSEICEMVDGSSLSETAKGRFFLFVSKSVLKLD